MDFIEISEHRSATGRLNWTERKPKMMKKIFFKNLHLIGLFYYFKISNVFN